MPDKIIEIPGVGTVAFPDSMTEAQISAAAASAYKGGQSLTTPQEGDQLLQNIKNIGGKVVDWLPTIGGMVGGTVGAAGGPVGAVAGAALGGAAGKGWQDIIKFFQGEPTPTTEMGAAAGMAGQAALQGGAQAAGPLVAGAMNKAAPRIMQSAVKPTVSMLKEYKTTAPKLVQTLLDEGVNVTQNGLGKLQKLFDATNDEIKQVLTDRDALLSRLGGSNAVVDKQRVAARVLPTAAKIAQQTNPTADLQAVGNTVGEFVNHPIFKGNLTLPEAQATKQGTYQQIGKKYGEMSSASVETQKALARGLKEEIADEVPQIADLNKRDAELMAAMDAVGRRVALAGNRDPVGFAWVAQHPATFLTALFDRSPAIKSLLARGLYDQAARVGKVSPNLIRTAVGAIVQGESASPAAAPPSP